MKTKANSILLILLALVLVPFGWTQDQTYEGPASYKGFSKGYCTYYAAMEFDKAAPEPRHNWRGDASSWLTNAKNKGWAVSSNSAQAEVNSLAIWNDGSYGHVGIVESVGRRGSFRYLWFGYGRGYWR